MKICRYCLEEIESHGEKIWISDEWEDGVCDWCEEEDEVTEAQFRESKIFRGPNKNRVSLVRQLLENKKSVRKILDDYNK